jgi:hypothetical protein
MLAWLPRVNGNEPAASRRAIRRYTFPLFHSASVRMLLYVFLFRMDQIISANNWRLLSLKNQWPSGSAWFQVSTMCSKIRELNCMAFPGHRFLHRIG